ncbi:MAG: winged helix-turn-helix transcriptional regulator, partial [Proteobacteria bacterium]|nr:winged helix-turn-helix transcriptional regulator [Pseudomonadota bacterium]
MTARLTAGNGGAGRTHTALPRLDRIDIRILAYLQRNGRATNVELAEAVGLSPSPCLMRVKRLEKAGYIAAYTAQ